MPSLSDMPTDPAAVNEVPQTPADSSGRVSSLILRSPIAALAALSSLFITSCGGSPGPESATKSASKCFACISGSEQHSRLLGKQGLVAQSPVGNSIAVIDMSSSQLTFSNNGIGH